MNIDTLHRVRAAGRAVIGFSIYNLEQGISVVRAAEDAGVPVLLQVGSSAFRYGGREPLARLAQGLAESARVPVGIHLDHATDHEEIFACLELGYTSVMFDGSALPLAANVRLTRAVVQRAHAAGAWVEAELAGIPGDEDRSGPAANGCLTDPGVAREFVAATGVDALAVAVGNVHGIPDRPVTLDVELLERIAGAVDVPLVLHGASGLPEPDVAAAIARGVAKLNVNTELRRAFRDALRQLPEDGDALPDLMAPVLAAMQDVAARKLRVFSKGELGEG